MTENMIVIVIAITQGQAEMGVRLQEVVEPQILMLLLLSLSRWKLIDGRKTCFAHHKPSLQIGIDRNDEVHLSLAKMTMLHGQRRRICPLVLFCQSAVPTFPP
jgi:hypothetical protein